VRGAAVADEVASSAAWKRGDLSVGLEFLTWASEAFEGRREGRKRSFGMIALRLG